MGINYHVQPALDALSGCVRVASDKSISHRALMLGALAEGTTTIRHLLPSEDVLATQAAMQSLGVPVAQVNADEVQVQGAGLRGLQPPQAAIDCGNSGTSMRLLAGILSAQPFNTVMTGDASLLRRPMSRIAEPLALMGAQIATHEGKPPLTITGQPQLHGIEYTLPVASAQIKSCLLLAGLYAEGETTLISPAVSRDHTERMLQAFGYPIEIATNTCRLRGQQQLTACTITIPADLSSAAFFLVAASIVPGSEVTLRDVGINPTRSGVLTILQQMGADITLNNVRQFGAEPVADLTVRYAPLRGVTITPDLVPLAIDEFPIIMIAAACAEGVTVLTGASELRVKESDRLAVMAEGLANLGIHCEQTPDGATIQGGHFSGGQVASHGDHRIAMAFTMAGLVAKAPVLITDCANVATSFPDFVMLAQQLGANMKVTH